MEWDKNGEILLIRALKSNKIKLKTCCFVRVLSCSTQKKVTFDHLSKKRKVLQTLLFTEKLGT